MIFAVCASIFYWWILSFFLHVICCSEQYDAAYERISMLFNAGLWYMKHALKFAALEEWVCICCMILRLLGHIVEWNKAIQQSVCRTVWPHPEREGQRNFDGNILSHMYKGRSINKLQKGIIMLVFKI